MPESLLPTDDRVRALAREVLARGEYAEFRRSPTQLQEFVAKLADWLDLHLGWLPERMSRNLEYIKDVLLGLLDTIFADSPIGGLARFMIAASVLVAIAASLIAIARALRVKLRDAPAAGVGGRIAASQGSLIAEAEGLASEGHFLEAAHCTQLASLEILLRREWISLARSDPNRTLRRRLEHGSLPEPERAEFLSLLDRLESRWFRDRSEDRNLYGAWRGLHSRLDSLSVVAG